MSFYLKIALIINLFSFILSHFQRRRLVALCILVSLAIITFISYGFITNQENIFYNVFGSDEYNSKLIIDKIICTFLLTIISILFYFKKSRSPLIDLISIIVLSYAIMNMVFYFSGNSGYSIFVASMNSDLIYSSLCALVALSAFFVAKIKKMKNINFILHFLVSLLFLFLAATFDAATPLGVVGGILYIPLIFFSLWSEKKIAPIIYALASSILVVIGFFVSIDLGVAYESVLLNRILSIFVIWMTAIAVYIQKNTFEKLLESEENFRNSFKNAAIGKGLVSLEGKWIEVNDSLCKIVGYSKQELLKLTFQDITHPDDLDIDLSYVKKMIEGKIQTYQMEKRYFHKNGNIVWIVLDVSMVKTPEGAPKYFISQIQDITKRKTLEQEVKDREKRYELVLEATRDGIWDWPDMSKDKEYWSNQWKNLLGYKDDEIEGSAKKFFDMLHPDDVEFTTNALDEHIKNGKPFDLEYRLKTKKGQYKWFQARGIVTKDEVTGISRMTGSITDIQKRKDAEDALKESEFTRQQYVESSYDGYWDWHLKDDYEYMSPRFWEMFGYDPNEKRHHPSEWQKIISKEGLELALKNFDKHVKTKGKFPFSQEVDYYHKDGSIVNILCRGKVIEWDDDGAPVRMIGTHTNLTQRRKMEDDLKESKIRFNLATLATRDGIWDWYDTTNEKEEQYWSPQFYDLLGYQKNEISSNHHQILSMIHPEDLQRVKEAFKKHFDSDAVYDIEYRMQTKDGSYKWFQSRGVKSINKEGNLRFTGSLSDISVRKQNEEEIIKFNKELKESNKELDEFAYIASHDLKEPLRGIHNYSAFLLEDYGDKIEKDGQDKLHTLVNLTQRLEQLLNELLKYSRLGRKEVESSKVDLNEVAKSAIDILKPSLEEKNAVVKILNDLPEIRGEKILINEVFVNLVVNGIKYNDNDDKLIEIGSKKENGQDVIFVRDNGIGIQEKHLSSVFRIFKRLNSREKYGDGTGFGLTFVKKIIEQHGGKIWLESDFGKGSTFYFTINN